MEKHFAENSNLTEYVSNLVQGFLDKIADLEAQEKLKNRFVEVLKTKFNEYVIVKYSINTLK